MLSSLQPARLLLIRHAQARYEDPDQPLTDLGRAQASRLALALATEHIEVCVSSPLPRALATAEALGLDATTDARLVEFDFGPQPFFALEHAEQRPDLALWRPEDGFPGGETLGTFQSRVGAVLEDLAGLHDGRVVAVFTHAGVIEAAIRWAYGLGPEREWTSESEIENASITELWHWQSGRHALGAPRFTLLRRLGDTRHLGPDLASEI